MHRRLPAFLLPPSSIITGVLFVVSLSWEEEQEEWYWKAVHVLVLFWSSFLQVTIRVRCRCPASPSPSFYFTCLLSLPSMLGLARPELFVAIMSLCRSITEKMKFLQSKRQQNPNEMGTKCVCTCNNVPSCCIWQGTKSPGSSRVGEFFWPASLLRAWTSWEAQKENKSKISME